MSMDNYIFVDKKFRVWDCTASYTVNSDKIKSLEGQKGRLLGKFNTFDEAVKFADKQESEYGTSLHLWAK